MKIEKIGSRNVIFTHTGIDEWNSNLHEIGIEKWNLNLHLIIGQKCNYIIDTGLGSGSIVPIKEYLNGNKNPIVVINTHYDWDHVWGNHCFKESIIISHRLCRELLEDSWTEMLNEYKQFIRGEVELCLPNMLVGDFLHFPEDKVKIFYTPGHTIDSISVFDELDNVLNVGDNIGDTIDEIVPRITTDKETYLQSIRTYLDLNINACISGHNTILGKEIFDKIIKEIRE